MAPARKLKIEKLRAIIDNYPLAAFIDSVMQSVELDTEDSVQILRATSWREKLMLLLEKLSEERDSQCEKHKYGISESGESGSNVIDINLQYWKA